MIPVYDPWDELWVGRVNPNTNLFYSNDLYGTDYGCTRLRKSKKFVLITSSYIGQSAEVIVPEDLIRKATELDALDYILSRWPELRELAEKIIDEEEPEELNK